MTDETQIEDVRPSLMLSLWMTVLSLAQSKRAVIMGLTLVLDLGLGIAFALGKLDDPDKFRLVWEPVIQMLGIVINGLAGVIVHSLGRRDPGQPPPGTTLLVLALVLVPACAGASAVQAQRYAVAAKATADALGSAAASHLEDRAKACAHLRGQQPALDECLGPVASHPDEIDAVRAAVHAKQLALYLVLARGDATQAEISRALADLRAEIANLAKIVADARGTK